MVSIDPILVGVITLFAVVIGGLLFFSRQNASGGGSGVMGFMNEQTPEMITKLQLDELLATRGLKLPEGVGAFDFSFPIRDQYEELKKTSDNPEAMPEPGQPMSKPSDATRAQHSKLLQRACELAWCLYHFETRVALVQQEYGGSNPTVATVQYLNSVAAMLREETAKVQAEAQRVKPAPPPGWGPIIMQQAMQLTVGLQKQKEQREMAEKKAAADKASAAAAAEAAQKKKVADAEEAQRAEKAKAAKKLQESEKSYKELEATLAKEEKKKAK